MDVESVFRVTFGIKKELDIVGLIEAAVSVAALTVPNKLKKHRSRILKLLFDEDPAHSTDLFSDDELCSDDEDEDEDDKDKRKVTTKNAVCRTSPKIKKTVELSQVAVAAPLTPLMSEKIIVGHQDKSMEATKKMVVHKYHEEAEKKAKRKIEQREVDFPEPKKHCNGDRSKVAKPPSGNVRMKAEHCKPAHHALAQGRPYPKQSKYKMLSGLI